MASEYHRGEMEIEEQEATYALFMGMTKWGSLGLAVLLLYITLLFCTATGFIGSTAASVGLLVVGIFALRAKPDAGH